MRPSSSAGSWAAYALIIAAFGPYVARQYGVMLAQVVLYPLAAWGLWAIASQGRRDRVRGLLGLPLVLLVMTIWVTLTTIFRHTAADAPKLVSMLDNYAQPFLVSLVGLGVVATARAGSIPALLRNCTGLYIGLLSANTLIALWSAVTGTYPDWLLAPWSSGSMDDSIMARAAVQMGRYTGVYQDAATAGLSYSLGLILTFFWLKRSARPMPWVLAALTLFVGAGLPRSKSFFVGAALAVVYLPLGRGGARGLLACFAAVLGMYIVAVPLGLESLTPHALLTERLTDTNSGIIMSLSGGRYGSEGGTTAMLLWPRIAASPWVGYGLAAGQFGPLDSEPLGHLLAGGFPALGVYLVFIAIPIVLGLRALARRADEGWLGLIIGLYLLLGGLGRPVLLANGVVLVVVLVLVLSLDLCRNAPGASTVSRRSAFGAL